MPEFACEAEADGRASRIAPPRRRAAAGGQRLGRSWRGGGAELGRTTPGAPAGGMRGGRPGCAGAEGGCRGGAARLMLPALDAACAWCSLLLARALLRTGSLLTHVDALARRGDGSIRIGSRGARAYGGMAAAAIAPRVAFARSARSRQAARPLTCACTFAPSGMHPQNQVSWTAGVGDEAARLVRKGGLVAVKYFTAPSLNMRGRSEYH